MKGSIVICDGERNYAEHLMEYLRRKLTSNYEIELYTSAEKLLELCSPNDMVLLVISQREYRKEFEDAGFPGILVLNETGEYLGDTVASCSKYQSMDTIASLVRQMCAKEDAKSPGAIRHVGPIHILGVYTPVSRCLQTTFSLTMGQLLARKGRALYLNLESYSGLEYLLGKSFRGSAADLLYYNECAKEKLPAKLGAMVESIGGLDFIPPMKSFVELRAIRGKEWLDFFHSIEKVTEYEYLILDLSEQIDNLLLILRECEQVFTIVRDDPFSRAKIKEYEQMLQAYGCEDVAAKTHRWQFPVYEELPAVMENLTHGEMADFVRTLLQELGY